MERNYEFSCGAILYKKEDGIYKYVIVKDRNNNYSFPKGHSERNEKELETAIREVKEEVGISLDADKYFRYRIHYDLDETTTKHVCLFMGDIKEQVPSLNDTEIQEILLLNYDDAYNLITYQQYKDALKEVNDRLINNMKICCMFDYEDPYEACRKTTFETIKAYEGDYGIFWHGGERSLLRCEKCGAYVLVQEHENHMPDHTYIDYFPVRDENHADEVSRKYSVESIESDYPYKSVLVTYNY